MVSKYIGYKWWRQLLDIMPVMIVSIIAALISYTVSVAFQLSLYVDGLLKIVVYAAVYFGWTYIFKPEASKNISTLIIPLKKKLGLKS